MSLLMFAILCVVIVGVAVGIAYYIPAQPPFAWLKWAIPVVALLIVLVLTVQRLGVAG
jgi:hypothetical protein